MGYMHLKKHLRIALGNHFGGQLDYYCLNSMFRGHSSLNLSLNKTKENRNCGKLRLLKKMKK